MPTVNPPDIPGPPVTSTPTPGAGTVGGGTGATPAPSSGITGSLQTAFTLDNGWWVLVGCFGGILVSGTRIAPLATGILAIALIYQLNLLLQGK